MTQLVFFVVVIIYIMWQILKRWKKMAKHETYTAIMNTGMAWGAIVAVLVFFAKEPDRLIIGGLFTVAFWSIAGTYFYWDYRKTHKKPEPILKFPPLTPQTIEQTKPITKSRRKIVFIKNFLFTILEVIETSFCLGVIRSWQIVTVSIGENMVPVLTYQNGLLLVFFIIGIILVVDIARRLRHPKENFFAE